MNNTYELLDTLLPSRIKKESLDDLTIEEKIEKFEFLFTETYYNLIMMDKYNKTTFKELKKIIINEDIKIATRRKDFPNVYKLVSPVFVEELKKEKVILSILKKWITKTVTYSDLEEALEIILAVQTIRIEREKKFKKNVILLDALDPKYRYVYDKLEDIDSKTNYLAEFNSYIKRKIKTI